MDKKDKTTLTIGITFGTVIVCMLLISAVAYPFNIQVYRSFDKVALDESDLPSGSYTVIATRRGSSDISAESIALGWKEGYRMLYLSRGQLILQQDISIYPRGNIEKVIDNILELPDWQVEELPPPNIGEKSRMYLLTQNYGDTITEAYAISFIKGDTYSILFSTDEKLLIEMAEKAENKIPEIYVSPFILLALALIAMYLLGLTTYSVYTNLTEKSQKIEK